MRKSLRPQMHLHCGHPSSWPFCTASALRRAPGPAAHPLPGPRASDGRQIRGPGGDPLELGGAPEWLPDALALAWHEFQQKLLWPTGRAARRLGGAPGPPPGSAHLRARHPQNSQFIAPSRGRNTEARSGQEETPLPAPRSLAFGKSWPGGAQRSGQGSFRPGVSRRGAGGGE